MEEKLGHHWERKSAERLSEIAASYAAVDSETLVEPEMVALHQHLVECKRALELLYRSSNRNKNSKDRSLLEREIKKLQDQEEDLQQQLSLAETEEKSRLQEELIDIRERAAVRKNILSELIASDTKMENQVSQSYQAFKENPMHRQLHHLKGALRDLRALGASVEAQKKLMVKIKKIECSLCEERQSLEEETNKIYQSYGKVSRKATRMIALLWSMMTGEGVNKQFITEFFHYDCDMSFDAEEELEGVERAMVCLRKNKRKEWCRLTDLETKLERAVLRGEERLRAIHFKKRGGSSQIAETLHMETLIQRIEDGTMCGERLRTKRSENRRLRKEFFSKMEELKYYRRERDHSKGCLTRWAARLKRELWESDPAEQKLEIEAELLARDLLAERALMRLDGVIVAMGQQAMQELRQATQSCETPFLKARFVAKRREQEMELSSLRQQEEVLSLEIASNQRALEEVKRQKKEREALMQKAEEELLVERRKLSHFSEARRTLSWKKS